MKRFKIVGLCLVAVFALTAVIASSASAASPEYFTCIKAEPKNTGEYSGKECGPTEKAASPKTGKYERGAWNAGKKHSFKGKGKTPTNNNVNPLGECEVPTLTEKKADEKKKLEKAEFPINVECTKYKAGAKGGLEGTTQCKTEKITGEITGPKTATWTTEYASCSAEGGELTCHTEGSAKGKIKTNLLESELVWLDAAHTKPGLLVHGAKVGGGPKGGLSQEPELAQYFCGTKAASELVDIQAFGSVLVEVSGNIEKAAKTQTNKVGEGAIALQGVAGNYLEEAGGVFGGQAEQEGAAKVWWEYELSKLACEKGEPPFPPGPHSAAFCEAALEGTFLSPHNPIPVKPNLIESAVSGVKTGLAPDNQNGTTENKGEYMGITG